jgi:hypothetical protein
MCMQRFSIFVGFERMRMYNNISIIYMNMIKEAVTRKKSQEQNQEKIPGNTIDSIFQVRSIKISYKCKIISD